MAKHDRRKTSGQPPSSRPVTIQVQYLVAPGLDPLSLRFHDLGVVPEPATNVQILALDDALRASDPASATTSASASSCLALRMRHSTPASLSAAASLFRLDDACGADQYRPTRMLNSGDLGHESLPFCRAVGKDDVLVVTAQARRVGRDHDDVEPVEFLELFRRRLCRGGHAA